jgi:hypothetical protein
MITLLMVMATLAVLYGLLWHDMPAETYRKEASPVRSGPRREEPASAPSNEQPSMEKRQRTAALQDGGPQRLRFSVLQAGSIAAGPQRLPLNKEKILREPIHQLR